MLQQQLKQIVMVGVSLGNRWWNITSTIMRHTHVIPTSSYVSSSSHPSASTNSSPSGLEGSSLPESWRLVPPLFRNFFIPRLNVCTNYGGKKGRERERGREKEREGGREKERETDIQTDRRQRERYKEILPSAVQHGKRFLQTFPFFPFPPAGVSLSVMNPLSWLSSRPSASGSNNMGGLSPCSDRALRISSACCYEEKAFPDMSTCTRKWHILYQPHSTNKRF